MENIVTQPVFLSSSLSALSFYHSSMASGSSTALAVCRKKYWSEPCTFNLANKSSTNDPVVPTPATANGESGGDHGSASNEVCALQLSLNLSLRLSQFPLSPPFSCSLSLQAYQRLQIQQQMMQAQRNMSGPIRQQEQQVSAQTHTHTHTHTLTHTQNSMFILVNHCMRNLSFLL